MFRHNDNYGAALKSSRPRYGPRISDAPRTASQIGFTTNTAVHAADVISISTIMMEFLETGVLEAYVRFARHKQQLGIDNPTRWPAAMPYPLARPAALLALGCIVNPKVVLMTPKNAHVLQDCWFAMIRHNGAYCHHVIHVQSSLG